ncbi:mitochondrial fission ELM1 family protein [Brevundimonas nasdae]|uniref:Mitochondrial fission ELM1 family protein n=1 Tax=Brevundimonas nasdae TaxID=172043 RepID=A0ABX8TGY0_9CAUL|nr:mitochondrial fission ELM1 family protein [Brevundimonas nasdae]QYC10491.1 mitochondrial fission ELM1 family protein [Brevundimonas nasdae]QYC13278.1 mitochondrial fission ELM1 family protein [Brevundimonas nasdae]
MAGAFARPRSSGPLAIWVVSDGRTGIENQALGLAEAVQRLTPADITIKHIRWRPLFDRWPSALKTRAMLDPASDPLDAAQPDLWPDVWIATGRATLPLSTRIKERSGGRTFVVQTQDPRWANTRYDMIVAPAHDGLSGDNVFEITGSPHRITPQRIAGAAPAFAERIVPLPHPRVAVLIGGKSKAFDLPPDHAADLADRIAAAVKASGGSLMLTFSRRTPDAAKAAMTARLSDLPGWIWDGTGDNPLFAFLHHADHILVTEDSANMAAEAASTGKPVHVLPMVPLKSGGKFARLHDDLQSRGATRAFDGTLDAWTYEPLAETDRAARAVLEAMSTRATA